MNRKPQGEGVGWIFRERKRGKVRRGTKNHCKNRRSAEFAKIIGYRIFERGSRDPITKQNISFVLLYTQTGLNEKAAHRDKLAHKKIRPMRGKKSANC
jgi:hypothetical protein